MGERWPAVVTRAVEQHAAMSTQDSNDKMMEWVKKAPKAELHLHLEGAIEPATVVELAARHGETLTVAGVEARYRYQGFDGFIEAFKWVTGYLRAPADYGLITERLGAEIAAQGVVYAEVTLAVGVMQLREQDAKANFAAIRDAGTALEKRGVKMRWVMDTGRQFGVDAAMRVARVAVRCKRDGVVAYGMGGFEEAMPAEAFRGVYEYIRSEGLHAICHAGETGKASAVREAIEALGAERIGHGIAAAWDEGVMELVKQRGVTLEVCPTSNVKTGALAKQLGKTSATIDEHPLGKLVRAGVRVTLDTDDPAMFQANLLGEYAVAKRLGLTSAEIRQVVERGFEAAFLSAGEKAEYLAAVRASATAGGLV